MKRIKYLIELIIVIFLSAFGIYYIINNETINENKLSLEIDNLYEEIDIYDKLEIDKKQQYKMVIEDEKIIQKLDDYTVKPLKEGSTKIILNNKKNKYIISVDIDNKYHDENDKSYIPLTNIYFKEEEMEFYYYGDEIEYQLRYDLQPINTTNIIYFKSNNSDIVEVNGTGLIKIKDIGTVEITAFNKSIKDTVKITITDKREAIKEGTEIKPENQSTPSHVVESNHEPPTYSYQEDDSNPTPSPTPTPNPTPTPSPSPSPTPTPTPTIVNPTGVSVDKSIVTFNMNNGVISTKINATVSPSNATNKSLTWTSSNTSIVTVDQNGNLSAKTPGSATITVKTSNGKTNTIQVNVTKDIIIIVGASQVSRMKTHVSSYSKTNNYSVNNGTLVFVNKGGSGHDYQVGEGWTEAKKYINNKNVKYHVIFPLSGNTIKKYSCNTGNNNITTSNNDIKNDMNNFNNVISNIKQNGYKVDAFVISMHPVHPGSGENKDKVVPNSNENSCTVYYRSNRKYYKYNKVAKQLVNAKSDIKFVDLFGFIMDMPNGEDGRYTYKVTYNTTDEMHWDGPTTQYYVKLMLDNISGL